VRKKLSFVPECMILVLLSTGDEALVEADDAIAYFAGGITLTSLISTRHDPIASAVYLQKMGTVDTDESFLESGASEISALPMNENSGGGES
jgi:hypothetical protein